MVSRCCGGEDFLRVFYKDRLREAGLENALGAELPYGVTVTERVGDGGKEIVFVMNFREETVKFPAAGSWTDVESGQKYGGTLEIGPFGCIVLKRD